MDPISMGAAAISAGGQIFGGMAQKKYYNYQAGVADMNAKIAQQNAEYSIREGEVAAKRSGMKTAELVAQEKVGQAAGNLDVNTGSAKLVRESQHDVGMEDQNIIRETANRKALGYEYKAAEAKASAGALKAAGNTAMISSFIGAASSVSSKWMMASKLGMGTSGEGSTFGPTEIGGSSFDDSDMPTATGDW